MYSLECRRGVGEEVAVERALVPGGVRQQRAGGARQRAVVAPRRRRRAAQRAARRRARHARPAQRVLALDIAQQLRVASDTHTYDTTLNFSASWLHLTAGPNQR